MSSTVRTTSTSRSVEAAAWALVGVQVLHGIIPAETASEGWVGAVAGLVLLMSAGIAAIAVRVGWSWGIALTGWTGFLVAAGFTGYHAMPFRSPFTNPYPGESVGTPAWIGVGLAVAIGAWAAFEGLLRRPAKANVTSRNEGQRGELEADARTHARQQQLAIAVSSGPHKYGMMVEYADGTDVLFVRDGVNQKRHYRAAIEEDPVASAQGRIRKGKPPKTIPKLTDGELENVLQQMGNP